MSNQRAERSAGDLSESILERLREAAALMFWELDAVRVKPRDPFRLASGSLSPIYVNCRRVISSQDFMELFVAAAGALCRRRRIELDAIAGGETAGIPFAAYLASALARPMTYVRKKAKGYGIASKVEGHLEPGSRVLLVEDLITDGGSKLGFLDALGEAGATVTDALVLFDREQGGAELLGERGVRLHAITGRAATLAAGVKEGLLAAEEQQAVEDYFRDPEAWSARAAASA